VLACRAIQCFPNIVSLPTSNHRGKRQLRDYRVEAFCIFLFKDAMFFCFWDNSDHLALTADVIRLPAMLQPMQHRQACVSELQENQFSCQAGEPGGQTPWFRHRFLR
jgi:hypothetical protein